MEKLAILGIIVVAVVWYFKSKKNKSKNVKDNIQEEFSETCCLKHSEVKEEVKEEVDLSKTTEINEKSKIDNLEVIIANLPAIIEAKAPVDCNLENLKELAKDIFAKQVEPISYSTIYKYIADHYGYRTWKEFKKILETK